MEITAVITHYNSGGRVLNTIQALYDQPTQLAAIMVIDNDSSDDSLAQVRSRFPEVQIIEQGTNYGPTISRNRGLREAQTPLVLLLDDDVYVAPDCLEKLCATHQQHGAVVTTPRIQYASEPHLVQCDGAAAHFVGTMILRHGYREPDGLLQETAVVSGVISSCLLLTREPVLAAGGFNESFFIYLDDLEFSNRLALLGHRLVCNPTAVAHHDPATRPDIAFRTPNSYPTRRAYMTMRHRLAILLLCYQGRTLLLLLPALLLYEGATLGLALLRGWGWAWLRAWGWFFKMLPTFWRQRRQLQKQRLVNDVDWLQDGPLPFNPNTLQSKASQRLVTLLSTLLTGYWRVAQPWMAT